jgi:hypothetical protein
MCGCKCRSLESMEDNLSSLPNVLHIHISHPIHGTLQEQHLYASHIRTTKELAPHDAPARSAFCQLMLKQSPKII